MIVNIGILITEELPEKNEKYCEINEAGKTLLKLAMDKMRLSARSYARILKVARTVADLDQSYSRSYSI